MTAERFWDWSNAFVHPATPWLVGAVALILLIAGILVAVLPAAGAISVKLAREVRIRTLSWFGLAGIMGIVILAGPGWFIISIGLLGLLCFDEFARATGLFRERRVYTVAAFGVVLVTFAALDHWYGLFVALTPLVVIAVAAISLPKDEPDGYLQRSALGVFGFVFFGVGLGHFGYMGNDAAYRPIVILLLLAVALSDVAAYIGGKLVGGAKLLPATSPGKTVAGALTGLVVTMVFVTVVSGIVFEGTAMDTWPRRLGLGIVVALAAPAGDLMVSAIKRDVGIKDAGTGIPGHGGFVDRFDSLLLVAPATFYYIGHFIGFGLGQPVRIITHG